MSSISPTHEKNFNLTSTVEQLPHGHNYSRLHLNSATKWLIYAALALVCIYRASVFRPQPLDAPGTLRPVLYAVFNWFVEHSGTREEAFAQWIKICFLALIAPMGLAVLNFASARSLVQLSPRVRRVLCSPWLFFTSVAVCLLLCRYPTLLQGELNPDEGAFLSAAWKLFYDPNYFHAIDSQTNGPLNIYPLMLPAIFGLTPDFASGRVLVIGIVVLCAVLLYRSVACLAPGELARLAVLPFVGAMAVFKETELRHYSSEYVPILLISVALYLSVRSIVDPARYRVPVFLLGVVGSAAFFAKLQSLPIVVGLAAGALAYLFATRNVGRRWRPALAFVAGTIPLPLLNALMCLRGGVWRDFWMAYVRSNVYYAATGTWGSLADLRGFSDYIVGVPEVRFFLFTAMAVAAAYCLDRLRRRIAPGPAVLFLALTATSVGIAAAFTLTSMDGGMVYTYLAMVAVCTIPMYFAVLYASKQASMSPIGWFGILALISTLAAIYSIYQAHRPFLHYLLFLFLPLSAGMAWMLIRQAGSVAPDDSAFGEERFISGGTSRGLSFVGLFLVLTFAYQSYTWSRHDDFFFKIAAPSLRSDEGEFVRSLTHPGPTVFVWGWNSLPLLGSGRVTATRDVHVVNCFRDYDTGVTPPKLVPTRQNTEVSEFYKRRLVRDLRANPPELFVDSISFTSWFINDPKYYGFEHIADLNRFVHRKYVLLTERYEPGRGGGQGLERFYLRRDLVAKWLPAHLGQPCAPGAVRCYGVQSSNEGSVNEALLSAHALPPTKVPAHALIEAEFVPIGQQQENATIFNNELVPNSFRGFRFQSIGGDRYRLLLGLGTKWAFSKSVLLPRGKTASISIEIDGINVYLRCNGVAFDDMLLSAPVVNPYGPITLGSWIDGQSRFSGAIPFFQIRDLRHAG